MNNNQARSGLVLTFAILLAIAGCSQSDNQSNGQATTSPATGNPGKRIASADVVKAVVEPVQLKAGGSVKVPVRLTIENGYHVNANPPSYPYLIATALEIAPAEGISARAFSYPSPITAKFSFAKDPIAVYEGTTEIIATLEADPSAKPGERSLSAKLRIQACDDHVCYPPGTRDLVIRVSIK